MNYFISQYRGNNDVHVCESECTIKKCVSLSQSRRQESLVLKEKGNTQFKAGGEHDFHFKEQNTMELQKDRVVVSMHRQLS